MKARKLSKTAYALKKNSILHRSNLPETDDNNIVFQKYNLLISKYLPEFYIIFIKKLNNSHFLPISFKIQFVIFFYYIKVRYGPQKLIVEG